MAEIETLARPYAEAVFARAEGQNALEDWSQALAAIATIVVNDDVAALIGNPEIEDTRMAQAIIDVAGDALSGEAQNLVRLLAENGRLVLAPAIAELYEAHRAEIDHRVEATVTSAVALSEDQARALTESLEKRFSCRVRLRFEQDERLIGGVIIRAGDRVIDGSLASQLERMRQSLAR